MQKLGEQLLKLKSSSNTAKQPTDLKINKGLLQK